MALIRPGPIQGQAVNPYIRRRRGLEEVTYLHPLLEPILRRTLGVPLFQEQLMEMAVAVAGFSAAEADELRQAMAAKRSAARMSGCGTASTTAWRRGGTGAVADQAFDALAAFANFGFPESHSVSFAHLVYSSAWLKLHYPAAFYAGLLNAQPMGFWSPQSLVADAKRHGVEVRRPHVDHSEPGATLEGGTPSPRCASGSPRCAGWAPRRRGSRRPAVGGRRGPGAPGRPGRAQLEALAAAGALDAEGPGPSGGEKSRNKAHGGGAAGCSGRPGRRPRPSPTGCRAWWWGPSPRAAPPDASTRRWATTCGRSGWPPTARPWSWPASASRRWTC